MYSFPAVAAWIDLVQISVAFQGNRPVADYVRYAQLMERYDFDAFHVYDDIMYRPCWPILFTVAPHTSKLKIGPSVTNPYFRHPAFTAANIACLDELTKGRAVLGVGRGSFYEEFGIHASSPITAVAETVEVVARLIRGDKTAYNGKVFCIAEGIGFKYECYRKTIPIFVGTWGRKLSEVAGKMREVFEVRVDTLWTPEYIHLISNAIEQGAKLVGRDPREVQISVGPQTSVSKDRKSARNHVKKFLPDYLAYPPYRVMATSIGIDTAELRSVTEAVARGDYKTAENAISDETIDRMTASGTPEDIIQGAQRMIRSGVSHISFCHPHGPDVEKAIRLLGEEVIPQLKA